MTKHTEARAEVVGGLVADLRSRYGIEFTAAKGGVVNHYCGMDKHPLIGKAISSILALQEKVKGLGEELRDTQDACSRRGNAIEGLQKQVFDLTAKLEAKDTEQEPALWVDWSEDGSCFVTVKGAGVPLYRAPQPTKQEASEPVAVVRFAGVDKIDRKVLQVYSDMLDTLPVGTEVFAAPQPTPNVKAAVAAAIRKAAEVCLSTRKALEETKAAYSTSGRELDGTYEYEWERSACRGEEYAQDILAIPHDDTALREICVRVAKATKSDCDSGRSVSRIDIETVVNRVLDK